MSSTMFEKRTTAPSKDNPFYYSNKNIFATFQKGKFGMPNCTCYALGRVAELTGEWLDEHKSSEGVRACRGNAETWYDSAIKAGLHVGHTPRIGAVVCWSVGSKYNGNDGAGHVAVVEEIYNNGDILTSNSAYGGTEFYTQVFNANKDYCWVSKKTGKRYNFMGFIYPKTYIKEPTKLLEITGTTKLYTSASRDSTLIATLKAGDKVVYDGIYYVAELRKFMHVRTYPKKMPITSKAFIGLVEPPTDALTGWVEPNKLA